MQNVIPINMEHCECVWGFCGAFWLTLKFCQTAAPVEENISPLRPWTQGNLHRRMEGYGLFSTTRMTVVVHRQHFHNRRPVDRFLERKRSRGNWWPVRGNDQFAANKQIMLCGWNWARSNHRIPFLGINLSVILLASPFDYLPGILGLPPTLPTPSYIQLDNY